MRKYLTLFLLCCCSCYATLHAQSSYVDSLRDFQSSYVKKHEVIGDKDKKFMRFFPVTEHYRVTARVQRIEEAPWFKMETSGRDKQIYRVYAIVHFKLNDTTLKLEMYQSQQLMKTKEYADNLFIPFTDLTSGEESYENGRYIELTTGEVKDGTYTIDFNKAYNPYCAYVSNQYNCPIPPKANNLSVAVRAGEMKFGKDH